MTAKIAPQRKDVDVSMTRFVLHIGYGKTGTTAIQRFLHHNRALLAKAKALYPDFFIQGAWLNAFDHNFLGRALAGRVGWWGQSAEQLIGQVTDQAHDAAIDTVILSAETFLGGVEPWEFDDEADYRRACQAMADRIARALDGHSIEIIVYLRRQDQWLESVLNQNIKYSGLLPRKLANASIEDTCRIYAPRTDYAASLDPWRAAFGKEVISVGVYERAQLTGGNVIADFLLRTGLNKLDLANPTWDPKSANLRLHRDVLEVKKILNRITRPKYEERAIVESLYRVSAALPKNNHGISTAILSTEARRVILETVTGSNTVIAREYLSRPDGVLFRDPLPDPDDHSSDYPGLDVGRAIEILLRLERDLNSPRGRARLFRHWFAEQLRKDYPRFHGIARRLRSAASLAS